MRLGRVIRVVVVVGAVLTLVRVVVHLAVISVLVVVRVRVPVGMGVTVAVLVAVYEVAVAVLVGVRVAVLVAVAVGVLMRVVLLILLGHASSPVSATGAGSITRSQERLGRPGRIGYTRCMSAPRPRYSPLEHAILARVVEALADLPVRSVGVFGSRARGHSRVDSDLDIAVRVEMGRSREVEQRISALAESLSVQDEASTHAVRVQIVPLFKTDAGGFLERTLAPELDPVWTRT
jgi:predicted nucleotidyltransferase